MKDIKRDTPYVFKKTSQKDNSGFTYARYLNNCFKSCKSQTKVTEQLKLVQHAREHASAKPFTGDSNTLYEEVYSPLFASKVFYYNLIL